MYKILIYLLLIGGGLTAGDLSTFAQQKPRVVISKLEDTTIQEFRDNRGKITQKDLDEGFEFHDNSPERKSVKVSVYNDKGEWELLTSISSNSTGIVYEIKKERVVDNHVRLQLSREGKDYEVKIKIDPSTGGGQRTELYTTPPCTDFSTLNDALWAKSEKCVKENETHPFGESVEYYDENTVVYVYDFNSNPGARRMYKVWKEKDGLHKKLVNINKETIGPKTMAYLKVVHVNRFLFDLIVDKKVLSLQSEPSKLFTELFVGGDLVGSLLKVFSTSTTGLQSTGNNLSKTEEDNFKNLSDRIYCYLQTYNALQAKLLQAYDPCVDFNCCQSEVFLKYYDLSNRLLEIRVRAAVLQNTINERKAAAKTLSDQLEACTKAPAALQALQKEKADLDKLVADNKPLKPEQKERLEALPKLITEAEGKICTANTISELKAKVKEAGDALKEFSAISDLLAKIPAEEDLRKQIAAIGNMVARYGEELYQLPANGNLIDISIKIKSNEALFKQLSIPPYESPEFTGQIPIVRRPFVSFSSGVFVGHPDYLHNKTYQWQQRANLANTVLDTAKYILVENGYSTPPVGFAALGNIEWKLDRNFGIGLSLGVGITIESNPRPAYLLGGSVFFGGERQFALTGGVAGMSINRLQKNWQAIADQGVIYATAPKIEYYKEFRAGAFVAFTYTPFTVK